MKIRGEKDRGSVDGRPVQALSAVLAEGLVFLRQEVAAARAERNGCGPAPAAKSEDSFDRQGIRG